MKQQCKSCPYFSLEQTALLKDILKWIKVLALAQDYFNSINEKEKVKELKQISQILEIQLCYSEIKNNANIT
jgi:hypothetical protein